MTYDEAIQFWFARVNYEHRTPEIGDFKLDRMRQLLAYLDDPHRRLRVIHVAGSKGKGSTSAMLASILAHAGFRVGLFTSPHLVSVEERVQVDREPIGKNEIAALLTEIQAVAPADFLEQLTFFEIGTALGFLHFVRQTVDFAIVEVGLGGRFDSTNVCDPLLSIITSISYDHTQLLGDTLSKIAFEKAGIVKPGRTAISGVRNAEARQVIEEICRQRDAPLRQVDVDFQFTHWPALITPHVQQMAAVQVSTTRRTWPEMKLALMGEHQACNAAVAVAAVEELIGRGVAIGDAAVAEGLARVVWPARLEIVSRRPIGLLDCAHNVASARALAQALAESFPAYAAAGTDGQIASGDQPARRILIFGGNRDKDLAGMLAVLAPEFDTILLTRFQGNQRCLSPDQLLSLLPESERGKAAACGDAGQAWQRARAEARPHDLICITGSVFLAGELRPLILAPETK